MKLNKIFAMLALTVVMVGSASAVNLNDEVDTLASPDVLVTQEAEVEQEDILEERQDIDGKMICHAGSVYKTILQSTNYDYVNGASLRVSFEESEGCELLGVLV